LEAAGPAVTIGGVNALARFERRVRREPAKATLALMVGAGIAYASYRGAGNLFDGDGDQNLLGRFVAWPGGTWPALSAGALVVGLLLVPDPRLEGRRRWAIARVTWWTTLVFAIFQIFDDHLTGHAGTPNPLNVSIPSPHARHALRRLQLLTGVVLEQAVGPLPWRLARWGARA